MVRIRIGKEEQQLTLETFEARVQSGQIPPDAFVQFEAVTGPNFVRAEKLELYQALRNPDIVAWRERFRRGKAPILTALLTGIMLRVHVQPLIGERLMEPFLLWAPLTIENAQPWRLLTMSLLHANVVHIAGNLLFFVYTAANIERALGRINLATVYLASVTLGSLLSMYATPESRSIGASGGIFGLIAFSVTFGLLRQELLPERGRRLFGFALLPYLVVMLGMGLLDDMTDNWCHAGGALAGALMGLCIDPQPMQRRPGWNRAIRGTTWTLAIALLAAIALLGPRIQPIGDIEVQRRHALGIREPLVDPPYRSLVWSVPSGWGQTASILGKLGFQSPGGERHLAVWESKHTTPQSPEALVSAWQEQVRELYPDAVIFEPEQILLSGRPGLGARVVLANLPLSPSSSSPEEIGLFYRAVVRGIYSLEATWQVELADRARLQPLEDRLFAAISWGEPRALADARLSVRMLPKSAKSRGALASALADVGQVDEALAIWSELVREHAEDPEPTRAILNTIARFPAEVPDPDRWITHALAQHPEPRTVTRIIAALEALERTPVAWGLLDIAWNHNPGDRSLASARRRRGLSTELTPRGIPWDRAFDPLTGSPTPPGSPEPLTLQAAERRGDELTERQRTLAAALQDAMDTLPLDPSRLLNLTLVLRNGALTADDVNMDDLQAELSSPTVPAWLPPTIDRQRLGELLVQ